MIIPSNKVLWRRARRLLHAETERMKEKREDTGQRGSGRIGVVTIQWWETTTWPGLLGDGAFHRYHVGEWASYNDLSWKCMPASWHLSCSLNGPNTLLCQDPCPCGTHAGRFFPRTADGPPGPNARSRPSTE